MNVFFEANSIYAALELVFLIRIFFSYKHIDCVQYHRYGGRLEVYATDNVAAVFFFRRGPCLISTEGHMLFNPIYAPFTKLPR